MPDQSFDLVILGGGSGGYAAALRASELGMSVAVIEKDKVGGTCLHRGCIPTKALLHAAEVADTAKDSAHYGIKATFESVDIAGVTAYRTGIVAKKFKGLQSLLKARGITTIDGAGTLASADDGPGRRLRTITGKHIVLATGSYSRSLPGLELGGRVIDSEKALDLDYVPKKVAVLGGGVIGVEFASVWRSFGADVTIIEALPHLIPNEEEVLSKALERAFRKRGIQYSLGVRFQSVTQDDSGVVVTLEDGKTIDAELLLVAVGRGPSTAGNGFEEAGVTLNRGFVNTNDRLETSLPGRLRRRRHRVRPAARAPQLPAGHLRRRGDRRAEPRDRLRHEHPADHLLRARGHVRRPDRGRRRSSSTAATRCRRYDYSLAGNAKSEILDTSGSIKVVRVKDGPVVGVHGIGTRVGELVGEAQLVVNWEAYPEDVAPYIHGHPTQYEALGEAFLALAGKPLHAL